MSNFYLAKYAALEDLAELIDSGASLEDCTETISYTLGQELNKHASEEDIEVALGIEAACYDFLKEASEFYATHHVNDEYSAMVSVLEKVAQDLYPEGFIGPLPQGGARVPEGAASTLPAHHDARQRTMGQKAGNVVRQAKMKARSAGKYLSGNKGALALGAGGALAAGALGYGAYRMAKNKKNQEKK